MEVFRKEVEKPGKYDLWDGKVCGKILKFY
jgi:hypothetical protein